MSNEQPPFFLQVSNLLRAGFGSEDIALKLCVPVELVRFQIRRMRHTGELAEIYGAKK